jgi:1-acyl-sn-glycerol-3-phosphate acyltransferase
MVRPLILIILGLNVRGKQKLPDDGPAIIVANHNSHLDTLVLIALFPLKTMKILRPVAAADYFLSNVLLKFFALKIMNIIPISRKISSFHEDLLDPISQSLNKGEIVIIYPEGTRGDPEQFSRFKRGISHLSKQHPKVPITPIFTHGLGKALPRGEGLFVPFFCDVFIGDSFFWTGERESLMGQLEDSMKSLANEGNFKPWN